ncbi:MAG: DUF3857 domain-containing protein [Candidatus Omnitrophota bacterium]|nr:DUF3857 domain-containing protein [Candidatus Omnitrophota bacterium]
MRWFTIVLISIFVLTGCGRKNDLELAREKAARSQLYYQHATGLYKKLIAAGSNAAHARFELGRLYFEHGEFQLAREEFEKSNAPGAPKFLAITDYHLGDYRTALELFDRNKFSDEQSRYFYALTAEKLNLFDQAVSIYKEITAGQYKSEALRRIEDIRKEAAEQSIKELSPEVSAILDQAPAAVQYPQAGALILSCNESIEINPDGTQTAYLYYLIKILNERGKEDFAEAKIDYDSTYESVELEYARTIKPDGRVAEVGSHNIRDVSKYMNFPLYSNARLYIISFPEVTEGAVVEYKLKIYSSELINKKDFMLAYPVQAQEPVLSANFSVTLPKDRPLRVKVINNEYNDFGAKLEPVQTEQKDGGLVYSWQFKGLPQIIPEANMPPSSQINPTLLMSTFPSWQEVYDWWQALAKDRILAAEPIKVKVKELIEGKASAEEKLMAIHDFCAKNIRYVAVEYGQAGYKPHQAEDIFRNKYGDCKDQSILLVTMLREAGIKAYPVLISTYDYYDLAPELPSALFDHCIAVARLDDKDIFIDPTASTCSLGDLPVADQQRKVLVFEDAGYKIQDTPLFSAGHNTVRQETDIILDKEGAISAQKTITVKGFYDQGQRYWLLYTQLDSIKETLKEKIQDISIGARLLDYQIDNLDSLDKPVILRYDFAGPEYFTVAGPTRIMPALVSMDTTLTAKDKRRYPLDLTAPNTKETIFNITIPDNFVIKYMPDNLNLDNPWFKFAASYAFAKNKLAFSQKTELKNRGIAQKDYTEFKKSFEELAKRAKQNVLLERKN